MIRERTLKVVLFLVGLLFLAGVYPLLRWQPKQIIEPMLGGIYAALGILLLLASRSRVNRSLIAFTTWSSVVNAGIMALHFHLLCSM